jgi:hypothetical protein
MTDLVFCPILRGKLAEHLEDAKAAVDRAQIALLMLQKDPRHEIRAAKSHLRKATRLIGDD